MKDRFAVSMFGQKRLSREGGIEIVVKELCTRMARDGCQVTCYNRSGHHVSGAEYDNKIEYDGIRQKFVPTIERKGLAAVSSSFFAALYSAFGKYDVVHIHAEGPAFFSWLPKMFRKRVVVTLRPDISYICAPDSVRTFRIKLFVENVVEFFAKIRIFGGSSPRFSPLGTNAHFTHVFTYGALTDGFARFT